MRRKLFTLAPLLILCSTLSLGLHADVSLQNETPSRSIIYFISPDSGHDYVSQRSKILHDTDGIFSIENSSNNTDAVTINYRGSEYWHLTFSSPKGTSLIPGIYKNAERHPFNSPKKPGLDIGGQGRGCGRSKGEFEVLDLKRDDKGSITSIAVNFLQSCDGGAAMIGTVRYNSQVPIDACFLDPFLSANQVDEIAYLVEKDPLKDIENAIFLTDEKGKMTIHSLPYGGEGFYIIYESEDHEVWTFTFVIPSGETLTKGDFVEAKRYPFQRSSQPGIDLTTPEATISVSSGKFSILKFRKKGDEVRSLAIDFEIESKEGKNYQGAIRYHSKIPLNLGE